MISWIITHLYLFIFLWCSATVVALDEAIMQAHLQAGAALLGNYVNSSSNLTDWMAAIDDSTSVKTMSIMGTHDSLTWNVNSVVSPFVQTQDSSLFAQLNSGSRYVDLRIGIDGSNKVRMYHSDYQLDSRAELGDIFWGMYHWLDNHPTETILVSVKVDNGENTASLQQQVFDLVTNDDVANYWALNTTLPTLGEARGKLIFLRRLGLKAATNYRPIGINLSAGWKDDTAEITINYATGEYVYIEDQYDMDVHDTKSAVSAKYALITKNLARSIEDTSTNSWFITFASGYSGVIVTPDDLALGTTLLSDVTGVNKRLLNYMVANRGRKFGVVLIDFFCKDTRLAQATLGWEVASSGIRMLPSFGMMLVPLLVYVAIVG